MQTGFVSIAACRAGGQYPSLSRIIKVEPYFWLTCKRLLTTTRLNDDKRNETDLVARLMLIRFRSDLMKESARA